VIAIFAVTGQDTSRVLSANTPKYHTADKHDSPFCHFKVTSGQPVLLQALHGEH